MADPIVLLGFDPAQHRDYAGVVINEVVPWRNPRTGDYPKDGFGYHLAQLNVRWPDRWRGENYEVMADKLMDLVDEYDVNMVVIDDTGVGSACGDILARRGLGGDRLMRVVFTGGDTQPNREPTPVKHTHHVSKSRIIASLVTLFEMDRIKGGRTLPMLGVIKSELKGYRVKVTESSNQIYINQDSEHDDYVCALALCSLAVQRLWALRYLPDLGEFVGHDDPPPTTQQQLAALPNHQRLLAEAARKKVLDGLKWQDLPEQERFAYRSVEWGQGDEDEEDAEEQQKAADLKRKARDAACWGDDDEKPESFLQGPSF